MKRVFAVLGALLMVVVALLVRSILDGDDDTSDGGRGSDGPVTLLCAEELTDVCATLEDQGLAEVEIEPVGESVDRLALADGRLDADAWLTLDPFPQIVDERRGFAGSSALLGEPAATGFSTPLAIVAFPDRAAALVDECGGGDEVDWSCLGDAAGEPWADHEGDTAWGDIKPGYDPPSSSATGLLVLAQAVADHVGRTDFALAEIEGGDTRRWLRDLEEAMGNRQGPVLDRFVQIGPSTYAAVGDLGIAADAAKDTAQGEGLVIFYPAPMFRAEVVLAAPDGDAGDLIDPDALAEALTEAGWDESEPGEPRPSPGALDALRSAWEDL